MKIWSGSVVDSLWLQSQPQKQSSKTVFRLVGGGAIDFDEFMGRCPFLGDLLAASKACAAGE